MIVNTVGDDADIGAELALPPKRPECRSLTDFWSPNSVPNTAVCLMGPVWNF
jgi:hypothetical protein